MKLESQPIESTPGSGVGRVARLVAMFAVLASALVGILIVIEVIPPTCWASSR